MYGIILNGGLDLRNYMANKAFLSWNKRLGGVFSISTTENARLQQAVLSRTALDVIAKKNIAN
jgi:hypothetical protein